jgi:hypothetical protein
MEQNMNQKVGRLALRVEGNWWVAYYAKPNTMDGAIEMGRIAISIVHDENRKHAFMEIMKSAIGDFIENKSGTRPDFWDETPAPENEKAGRA